MSVSLSPGESALVSEEIPTSEPAPESLVVSAETSFVPPPPTIELTPTPLSAAESTPPAIHVIATTADVRQNMPTLSQKERAPRTNSTSGRRRVSSLAPTGMSAGSGGGAGYVPPQFLLRYKPPYPAEARAQRIEGVVLLLVGVDAEGHVTSANIQHGSGHAMLDRAALDAVRKWRFSPALQSGRAIPATVEIPIRFNVSA
jgi:protein TonB